MAVVTVRSQLITNIVASPPVQNPVTQENGRQRASAAVVTLTNGDSINSQYKIARVLSHWRMQSIRVFTPGILTAAANLGLYRTDADGGAVVSVSCYGAAINLSSNLLTGAEQLFTQRTVDKLTAYVWQDAGYTVDPKLALDLVFTCTGAPTATGFVAVDVGFVVD